MKTSIRSTRFTMGIILFMVIILLLSIFSAFYLNRLSKKTSAILKENHYSVVFARDMSEDLTKIDNEITYCFLQNKNPDIQIIDNRLKQFVKSLQLEKNNITEVGEGNLVSYVETGFTDYNESVMKYIKSPMQVDKVILLQMKSDTIYQKLMLISQINEKAIEEKTEAAKVSAKKASIQMSIIGALCFLIAYGFTFSFSSYFNDRFYELYNGIKEMADSKYSQKLDIKGKDEIFEISLILNKMANELNNKNQEKALTLQKISEKNNNFNDIQELKEILFRMKSFEEEIISLIYKIENKN
jgi:DNA polymerase II small subunit/DNA polymerase delta subunit B